MKNGMKIGTSLKLAVVAALTTSAVAVWAQDNTKLGSKQLKPLAPIQQQAPGKAAEVPQVSPITLKILVRAGASTALGANAMQGLQKVDPGLGNSEAYTLSIEITNRTPKDLENVQIRYTMQKVLITHDIVSNASSYQPNTTQYNKTVRESAPTKMAEGVKMISLKPVERQVITARGSLRLADPNVTRNVVDSRGKLIGTVPDSEEQFYGYTVEATYNGQVVARQVHPTSTPAEGKIKRLGQ